MTANRHTNETTARRLARWALPAIGLAMLTLAAATARAQMGPMDASGDATCEAGCEGGCPVGPFGGRFGFSGGMTQNCAPEATCGCADDSGCGAERGPLFPRFSPWVEDFCERCGGCSWRADASALYIQRSDPRSANLLTDNGTGATLVDASDLQFPYRIGPRLSFILMDCAGWGVEVNYFSIDGWSATRNFTSSDFSNGVANLALDSFNIDQVTTAHIDFTSMFYSSEINLRRDIGDGLDAIFGFRWVDMEDHYFASGLSAVTGNTVRETIHTRNQLFGFQSGFDGHIGPSSGIWKVGAYLKAGGMLNNAHEGTSLDDPGNFGTLAANDGQCHVAFFGEAGLNLCIRLQKHVCVSLGYQVMYVDDVAQPSNQLAQTTLTGRNGPTTLIDVGSGVFYQGGNLGLEVGW